MFTKIKDFKIVILVVLVLMLTFAAFSSCLKNGFVNWDDNAYIHENPIIKDFSYRGIARIFTTTHLGLYKPLVLLSFAIEHYFLKLNPFVYHATNLVFHLVNCVLVFVLIYHLVQNPWTAFIVALLFGIHPLRVESVAWIAERKDMLYGFFILLASIFYLRYLKTKVLRYYYFSLITFSMSFLAKPMGVFFPLLMPLFDYFIGTKDFRRSWVKMIPFFAIAVVVISLAMCTAKNFISHEDFFGYLKNGFFVAYEIVFYIGKLFFPVMLSCLYPIPVESGGHLPYLVLLSPLVIIVLFLVLVASAKFTKKAIFGALFFIIALLPALQVVRTSSAIVADRYTYIASIGIFFIIAEIFLWVQNNRKVNIYIKLSLVIALILIVFNFVSLTRDRCKIWKNSYILWSDVINKYANEYIPVAYFNRGIYCSSLNERLALSDLKKALQLYSQRFKLNFNNSEVDLESVMSEDNYDRALNALGIKFAEVDKPHSSIILFETIIARNPDNVDGYLNLCVVYGILGEYKDAILFGEKAIKLNPGFGLAHLNLASAYYFDKQYERAAEHLKISKQLGANPTKDVSNSILKEVFDK